MAWTTPPTVVTGTVISSGAFGNVIRDDLLYLLSRPAQVQKYDKGSNITTTSTSFTPIDAANLNITLTLSGDKVLVGFTGVLKGDSGDQAAAFDILRDPSGDNQRYTPTALDGIGRSLLATTGVIGINSVVLLALFTGLAPGAHTFRPVWKVVAAGTATLFAGANSAGTDFIPTFWAMEV